MFAALTYSLRAATLFAALTFLLTVRAAVAQDFIPGAEDLPLMEALSIQEDDTVVFDDPEGRIVEAYATGKTNEADVLAFYTATLPELGWQQMSAGRFAREDESLTLDFSRQDEFLVVRFTLAPQ